MPPIRKLSRGINTTIEESLLIEREQLATGRKIRVLTVVDTFSRFSPVVDPRFSCRGEDVVATLDRTCRRIGYPKTIRVDQGSEFISRDLELWAYQRGVELDFSRPGKPTDNAFIESFNGKFRSECLNAHWFLTLDDARSKMEEWRKDYNTVRPHKCHRQQPLYEISPPKVPARGDPKTGSTSIRRKYCRDVVAKTEAPA